MKKAGATKAAAVALLGLLVAGCSGSPTAAGGTGGSGTPPGCRTYASADRMVSSAGTNIILTSSRTCSYNRSTNEFTCTADNTSGGVSYTSVLTFKFDSVRRFVGDAPRIYIFASGDYGPTSATSRVTTAGVASSTSTTYSYDGQRRLTRIDIQGTGGPQATTFSAWDTYGRPTAGADAFANYTYAYDDTNRIGTTTSTTSGFSVTQVFDANGIQIRQSTTSPAVTSSDFTIQSTATECG